jgi:hypothetical protein
MRTALLTLILATSIVGRVSAQDVEDFERRCRMGDLPSCNIAGLIYETGSGEDVDVARAMDFYRLACVGRDAAGCAAIGLLYQSGRGVERDAEVAADQYRLGCDRGGRFACDLLAALEHEGPITEPRPFFKTGRVLHASSGQALPGALVSIPRLGIHPLTDEGGRVDLGQVLEGTYRLFTEALGYEPIEGSLNVPGYAEFIVMVDRIPGLEVNQRGRVGGVVLDARGSAVGGVDVTVVWEERTAQTSTDATGRFVVGNVEPGIVEVRFSYGGREDGQVLRVVQPGRTTRFDATLREDRIEIEWPD